MKITKSHLRKIIQEELREMTNISEPMHALGDETGDAGHPKLIPWAEDLMMTIAPEITQFQALIDNQDTPEGDQRFEHAVDRLAGGMWKGIMDALRLAPEPPESAEARYPSPLDEYQNDEPPLSWEETLNSLAESIDAALGLDTSELGSRAPIVTDSLRKAEDLLETALSVYNEPTARSQEGTEQ